MPINNLGLVQPANVEGGPYLIRCAQPTTQDDFDILHELGIKQIFKLNSDSEFPVAQEARMAHCPVESVFVDEWHPDEKVIRPLVEEIRIASLTQSILVHCTHGRERTGAVIGAYRIIVDKWDNARTVAEFKSFGVTFFIRIVDEAIIEFLTNLKP